MPAMQLHMQLDIVHCSGRLAASAAFLHRMLSQVAHDPGGDHVHFLQQEEVAAPVTH